LVGSEIRLCKIEVETVPRVRIRKHDILENPIRLDGGRRNRWKGVAIAGSYLASWGLDGQNHRILVGHSPNGPPCYLLNTDFSEFHVSILDVDRHRTTARDVTLPPNQLDNLGNFQSIKRVAVSRQGYVAVISSCQTKILIMNVRS